MTPAEYILSKQLVGSGLTASEWDTVQAGLRTRAFFSSRIEDVRHLEDMRALIGNLLAGAETADGSLSSRAQAVSAIMRGARDRGLSTGKGGLKDPASVARAALIVDTNAGLAAGYADYAAGASKGARLASPCQELLRLEARKQPRKPPHDWPSRWTAAGGELYGGRMIALKGAPECYAVSRFGVPYGPPDYNSGMGWRGVSFEDALSLGVITGDYDPPAEPLKDFNATLEADLEFKGADDPAWLGLQETFGDQIAYRKGKVVWQGDLIRDALKAWQADPSVRATTRLGSATDAVSSAAPELAGKRLSLAADKVGHIYKAHVGAAEADRRNVPLADSDPSLIPFVWREPERVIRQPSGAYYLERDSADGHTLRLVVDPQKDGLQLDTFYKVKKAAA